MYETRERNEIKTTHECHESGIKMWRVPHYVSLRFLLGWIFYDLKVKKKR